MMLSKPAVLSQEEMEKVHAQSLRILEHSGVRVRDEESRAILREAGAMSGRDNETMCLPAKLVEECLLSAPQRFSLYRLDGTAVEISTESRVFGSLVLDPWIIDYDTQLPRRPLLRDVARNARLGDALDNVDFMYLMDIPTDDLAGEEAYIRVMETFAVNRTKPVMAGPSSQESLMRWIELAEILADGRPLSERPMLLLGAPVTTPLTFNALNAEIMKAGVRRGLPICAQTEPIAGITAPLSFAGGLLMGNCENLFLVVMTQLLRRGAPIAYSIGNALMDFQSGRAIFYPADKMLWKIASSQMAQFYRLPIEGEATGSLVGRYDTQNGIEHALHILPAALCGGGMYNGLGSCYNACGMSAEMVLIHSDLLRLTDRLRKGIDLSDEMLDTDSIIETGAGGHFLEDPLTIDMLRSGEFFTTGCFDRLGEQSANRFEDSMLARAHGRVEELVSSHTPAVPENIARNVHRWAEKACQK